MNRTQVLIAGAGPTGLVLALWLTLQGVKVRIVDRTSGPGTTSRALAVQARTLELYRQAGLGDAVASAGHRTPALGLWARGRRVTRVSLEELGAGLSPYAVPVIYPQDEHERLLIERLKAAGVQVERSTELVAFVQSGKLVRARLRRADGAEEEVEAAYLAGCDGAHSGVREAIGAGFPGGSYRQLFYVADVEAGGPPINGELNVDLDEADFLAIFPLAGEGRARLVGSVRDERADRAETLGFEDVSRRAIQNLKLQVHKVNWFSTYHVHHRVAGQFRKGRAFILGDAAHIHSPAGGQGMNTGIGDAVNLAWKLKAVLAGEAPERLLDSYEAERIGFARKLVATTDQVFTFATAEGRVADIVRTRIAPLVAPAVTSVPAAREFLFRTIGQLALAYRDSPLSAGKAGEVHGGDRLPWLGPDGPDNFAPLSEIGWQVHVYGEAPGEVADWCAAHGLPLHAFAWSPACHEAGFARNGLYLLRPDTYVALAAAPPKANALERYFSDRGIKPYGNRAA